MFSLAAFKIWNDIPFYRYNPGRRAVRLARHAFTDKRRLVIAGLEKRLLLFVDRLGKALYDLFKAPVEGSRSRFSGSVTYYVPELFFIHKFHGVNPQARGGFFYRKPGERILFVQFQS